MICPYSFGCNIRKCRRYPTLIRYNQITCPHKGLHNEHPECRIENSNTRECVDSESYGFGLIARINSTTEEVIIAELTCIRLLGDNNYDRLKRRIQTQRNKLR